MTRSIQKLIKYQSSNFLLVAIASCTMCARGGDHPANIISVSRCNCSIPLWTGLEVEVSVSLPAASQKYLRLLEMMRLPLCLPVDAPVCASRPSLGSATDQLATTNSACGTSVYRMDDGQAQWILLYEDELASTRSSSSPPTVPADAPLRPSLPTFTLANSIDEAVCSRYRICVTDVRGYTVAEIPFRLINSSECDPSGAVHSEPALGERIERDAFIELVRDGESDGVRQAWLVHLGSISPERIGFVAQVELIGRTGHVVGSGYCYGQWGGLDANSQYRTPVYLERFSEGENGGALGAGEISSVRMIATCRNAHMLVDAYNDPWWCGEATLSVRVH